MIEINDIIEGKILTLAFGGEGIMRERGFVIFVPFTAIGDRITCQIKEVKKSFAKGVLVDLLEPSPDRTTPKCPYYGKCGGCQLQHLKPEAQADYKLNAVRDSLRRIGHLVFPLPQMIPASLNWAYRRHITLHLGPKNDFFEAGYIAINHHSHIAVQTCPIFTSSDDTVVSQIQKLVALIPNPTKESGRVTILKNHQGRYILSFLFERFIIEKSFLEKLLPLFPSFAGIILDCAGKQTLIGDCYSELHFDGLDFRFTPQAFVQNHPEQSLKIYQQIASIASQEAGLHILDLYCGFGITSLLLARQGHHVTGIEFNPHSIRFAEENSSRNHLQGKANFLKGDVEKILPRALQLGKDLMIINPPRQGLTPEVRKLILKANAKTLIYISCMPSTLARDLSDFSQKGYKIENITIYDMFPQTAHVETLVCLRRTAR